MKKIFFMMLTIVAGTFAANAQVSAPLVISAGQLKKLDLGAGMKVTLVRTTEQPGDVKGATAVFEKLSVSISNGTMHIHPRAKFSEADTVLVVVDALETLVLGQNTKVNTQGILPANNVKVFVQEGATARLVTSGSVNAFSLDDVNVNIERRPIQFNAKVM